MNTKESNETLDEKLNKKKSAIYIRVSTSYQIDKDSLSVQRRELIAYSEFVLGIPDYTIFEDPGYSAKNTDRPAYQEMMEKLRTGEFSHLLVWKIDRISRNLLDFTNMYNELKKLGVNFVSKNEQFDTSSAIGEAMLKIILVFAELERKMTSERVTATMLSRANVGKWNGGRVPFGYNYDKTTKTFSFNEDEIKIYRTICNMYEECHSVLTITKYLNANGITTRAGNDWSATTVHKLLKNIWYIGAYRYNVHDESDKFTKKDKSEWITVYDHHIPAITKKQYDNIQHVLETNKKRNFDNHLIPRLNKNIHIFAGKLVCGKCGSGMSATPGRFAASGIRYSTYGCKLRRGGHDKCDSQYVAESTIGPFVFTFLHNCIMLSEDDATLPPSKIERKLLQGKALRSVKSLNKECILQMQNLLKNSELSEFLLPEVESKNLMDEYDILKSQKRKFETALSRLDSLYFFGNDAMPEKDYILKKDELSKQLEEINSKLNICNTNDDFFSQIGNEEIHRLESYITFTSHFNSKSEPDYKRIIKNIDQAIPRKFIIDTIHRIVIDDGIIKSIQFNNGIICKFEY